MSKYRYITDKENEYAELSQLLKVTQMMDGNNMQMNVLDHVVSPPWAMLQKIKHGQGKSLKKKKR